MYFRECEEVRFFSNCSLDGSLYLPADEAFNVSSTPQNLWRINSPQVTIMIKSTGMYYLKIMLATMRHDFMYLCMGNDALRN